MGYREGVRRLRCGGLLWGEVEEVGWEGGFLVVATMLFPLVLGLVYESSFRISPRFLRLKHSREQGSCSQRFPGLR